MTTGKEKRFLRKEFPKRKLTNRFSLKKRQRGYNDWSSSDEDSLPEIDEKEVEAGWDDTCDVIDTNDNVTIYSKILPLLFSQSPLLHADCYVIYL